MRSANERPRESKSAIPVPSKKGGVQQRVITDPLSSTPVFTVVEAGWVTKGRAVYRTLADAMMAKPYNSTCHSSYRKAPSLAKIVTPEELEARRGQSCCCCFFGMKKKNNVVLTITFSWATYCRWSAFQIKRYSWKTEDSRQPLARVILCVLSVWRCAGCGGLPLGCPQ